FRVEVVVDLAAGAAGTAGARSAIRKAEPVVLVLVAAVDVDVLDALLAPEAVGVIVVEVDGDVEALRRDPVDLREELPSPGDGLALEVVAEAEVAEHLERGAVREVADFLDVGGTETRLDGGCPRPRGLLFAGEDRLELLHPGGGEEGCWVADWDERPGR